MTRIYRVSTPKYGDILKIADNIQDARAWAKAAFGTGCVVDQHERYRFCSDCQCAPCCCEASR